MTNDKLLVLDRILPAEFGLPLRQADLGGFGHLADDDEEGEFVEKFDQSTASITLEALITA